MHKTGRRRRVESLRDRWCARSLATVWPGAADEWQTPAVEAVCEALTHGSDDAAALGESCRALGEQRALVGVALEEARADLDLLARLTAADPQVRACAVDALTVGWATCTVDRLLGNTGVDPLTEYATISYLAARLAEIYAEARVTNARVSETHVIVVVATERANDRLVRQTRMITLHSALRFAFIGGESLVSLGPARAAALALRSEPRLADSLAVLRSELRIAQAEDRLPSARVWLVRLPGEHGQITDTLHELVT
jgi:hypothetical protein